MPESSQRWRSASSTTSSKAMAEYFARVPLSVLADEKLTDFDLRVYACIALKVGGSSSWAMPQGELARMARGSERGVRNALLRLEEGGHISRAPGPRGVHRYSLKKADVPSEKDAPARATHVQTPEPAFLSPEPTCRDDRNDGAGGEEPTFPGDRNPRSDKQDHQEPSKIIQEEMSDQVVAPAQGADAPAQVDPELRKRLRDEARERIRALGSDPREKHRRPYGDPGTA